MEEVQGDRTKNNNIEHGPGQSSKGLCFRQRGEEEMTLEFIYPTIFILGWAIGVGHGRLYEINKAFKEAKRK